MKSNPSSSTASSTWRMRFDPSVVLLPIFIGFLRAAPFVTFMAIFLHPSFGLTNNAPAPNGWALAAIGAIGFWSVRGLPKVIRDARVINVFLLLIGIACWFLWMALEPEWHVGEIVRNPILMVSGQGQFGWTFVITLVFWILTLRLALDDREQSPEGVRGIMARSLVAVLVAIFFAGIIGGEMGDAGLSAGYIALPVALVSGMGAVGLGEMVATRMAARRRGATVPGWSRWGRTFLGSAVLILVITFIAALIFGPGFLALVIESLATLWSGIATVLLWIMYGVVYVIFWIISGVIWLLNLLFNTDVAPVEMPQMAGDMPEESAALMEGEREPWKYAPLLRFGGIIALVIIALLIITRFIRFRQPDDALDPNEERTSVFSGSLLRNQMRNLFRRRGHGERPRRLNLATPPESVRESMLYLQVLAERLGIGREIRETPHDFTTRLGHQWPQLKEPLAEIRTRYERVRYGESEEDRAAVVAAWTDIWAAQKDLPGATGS